MNFASDSYTAVGGRTNNEDALLCCTKKDCHLFAVADGLGGHDSGELASELVINEMRLLFEDNPSSFDMEQSILSANRKILQLQEETGLKMKTTIVAAYVADKMVYVTNVGDSRIYAFKDDKIIYQSIDHSASQMAVTIGEITPEQIRNHEDRNVLTRALGVSDNLKVDCIGFKVDEFDALLLCSDGFWEYVLEEDMVKTLLTSKNPDVWLYKMREVLCSNTPPNNDNNTAITVMKRGE